MALRELGLRLPAAVSSTQKVARPPRAGTPRRVRPRGRPEFPTRASGTEGGGGERNSKPTLCFQPAPFQPCQPPGGPSLHTRRGPAPPLTWPRSGGNSNHLSGTHTQQPPAVPSATPLGRALAPPRFRPQCGFLEFLLVPRPFESSPALPIGRAPWRVRPARSRASGVPTRLILGAQAPRRALARALPRTVPGGGLWGRWSSPYRRAEASRAVKPRPVRV